MKKSTFETGLIELKGKLLYNTFDIETLEKKIRHTKRERWYAFLFGLGIGILGTIGTHFIK